MDPSLIDTGLAAIEPHIIVHRAATSMPPEAIRDRSLHAVNSNSSQPVATNSASRGTELTRTVRNSGNDVNTLSHRETKPPIKLQLGQDTLVVVEVNLNFYVPSEQGLIVDLIFLFSEIYQCPTVCISLILHPDLGIMFNGSSDPAYQIVVTTSETDVAASKNKRAAGLLQEAMLEAVNVPVGRGICIFHIIPEENIIANAVNLNGGNEKEDNSNTGASKPVGWRASRSGHSSRASRKSTMAQSIIGTRLMAKKAQRESSSPQLEGNLNVTANDISHSQDKKGVKKRKSLRALLGF